MYDYVCKCCKKVFEEYDIDFKAIKPCNSKIHKPKCYKVVELTECPNCKSVDTLQIKVKERG